MLPSLLIVQWAKCAQDSVARLPNSRTFLFGTHRQAAVLKVDCSYSYRAKDAKLISIDRFWYQFIKTHRFPWSFPLHAVCYPGLWPQLRIQWRTIKAWLDAGIILWPRPSRHSGSGWNRTQFHFQKVPNSSKGPIVLILFRRRINDSSKTWSGLLFAEVQVYFSTVGKWSFAKAVRSKTKEYLDQGLLATVLQTSQISTVQNLQVWQLNHDAALANLSKSYSARSLDFASYLGM